jgi:adsorption protein B
LELLVTIALVLALLAYLVSSVDDVVLDLAYWWFHRRIGAMSLNPQELEKDPPKRIAVMVPAWQEAGVVAKMVESTLDMMVYPKHLVDFFVGVYPNDKATVDQVTALVHKYPNVHCIINDKQGPTNKSQNLNQIYAAIEQYERWSEKEFFLIAQHDAEDLIHPYAFKLYNSLIRRHAAVQLPVFPILPRLSLRRWWSHLISGTYADEFADNHLHAAPVRNQLGLFVPSAGTGFAVRREVLSQLAKKAPLFREDCLTEDYELALRLWRMGHPVHFHLQRVPRVNQAGQVVSELVGVREHFPTNWQAAVKQKGRWIYGITLQVPKQHELIPEGFKEAFTFWRDQKGRFTNLVHLLGYPVFFYAFAAFFLPWLPKANSPVVFWLGLVVLLFALIRLALRFHAISSAYGLGQAMLATFVFPFFPLRWIAANFLNASATLRAWRLWRNPGKGAPKGSAPTWDKTERKSYVEPELLDESRRRLGDNLLLYNDLPPDTLASLLKMNSASPLGERIIQMQGLPQNVLKRRLAETKGVPFVEVRADMVEPDLLPERAAIGWCIAPLGTFGNAMVVATPHFDNPAMMKTIAKKIAVSTGKKTIALAAEAKDVLRACERAYADFRDNPAHSGERSLREKDTLIWLHAERVVGLS